MSLRETTPNAEPSPTAQRAASGAFLVCTHVGLVVVATRGSSPFGQTAIEMPV